MSRTQSEPVPRRRASNTPPDIPTSAAPARRRSTNAAPQPVADAGATPGDRDRMIAEAAYYRAERRGFAGDEADRQQDWLEAETEIDRVIAGEARGDGGN